MPLIIVKWRICDFVQQTKTSTLPPINNKTKIGNGHTKKLTIFFIVLSSDSELNIYQIFENLALLISMIKFHIAKSTMKIFNNKNKTRL